MKKTLRYGPFALIAAAPFMWSMASAQIDQADLPPNAKAGECYARVLSPERYETVSEEMVVVPETETIEIDPAQYDWDEKEIIIKEASEQLEVIPGRYESRTETIVVEPERVEYQVIPAQFSTKEERIKVREGYTTWKKGTGPFARMDSATGEIMCLVEVPAEYKTQTVRVMTSPPRTEKMVIPAKSKTIEREVLVNKWTTRAVTIPAVTETVRYQKLVTAPRERRVKVPAVYDTVTTQKMVSSAQLEWAPILCETNVTPGVMRSVQTALQREGFYNGPIDGTLGPATMSAVDAYQRAEGLATGGLTLETVRKLKVPLFTS
ncbi:MAG: peptidoglycan-binding domain-containing protein [Parvularculaceae bacterium]